MYQIYIVFPLANREYSDQQLLQELPDLGLLTLLCLQKHLRASLVYWVFKGLTKIVLI